NSRAATAEEQTLQLLRRQRLELAHTLHQPIYRGTRGGVGPTVIQIYDIRIQRVRASHPCPELLIVGHQFKCSGITQVSELAIEPTAQRESGSGRHGERTQSAGCGNSEMASVNHSSFLRRSSFSLGRARRV